MKRDQLAFLAGGLLFGILIGYGLFHAVENRPELDAPPTSAAAQRPQGPPAPTDPGQAGAGGGGGGAPMMAMINDLKRRLQDDPQDIAALVQLADTYNRAAIWDQAAGYYERALELRPDEPDLLTDLGVCYRNLQQSERALEHFRRAQQADESHWQSLFNIVVVAAFDLQRFDLALEALESMEALDPRPAELDAGRLGELRQALEHAQAAAADGERS